MSAADWPIVREVAIIFGYIMRGIYLFFSSIGIYSIPVCIIAFTVVSKILIIPSTYRRQKLSLLSPKLLPLFEDIENKYTNKNEHPLAKNKKNVDKGFIFKKYGLSTGSGIAMTLLQLPILFALYAIIQDVPRFVPELNALSDTQMTSAFSFFGMHVNEVPGLNADLRLLFPFLTAFLQLFEMLQMSIVNRVANNGKIAGGMSNVILVAMMFWFSCTMPIICSIYWITNTLINILINFAVVIYVKNKDLSYFSEKQLQKINKTRIKKELEPLTSL